MFGHGAFDFHLFRYNLKININAHRNKLQTANEIPHLLARQLQLPTTLLGHSLIDSIRTLKSNEPKAPRPSRLPIRHQRRINNLAKTTKVIAELVLRDFS